MTMMIEIKKKIAATSSDISQNKSNNEMVIKLRTSFEDWKEKEEILLS